MDKEWQIRTKRGNRVSTTQERRISIETKSKTDEISRADTSFILDADYDPVYKKGTIDLKFSTVIGDRWHQFGRLKMLILHALGFIAFLAFAGVNPIFTSLTTTSATWELGDVFILMVSILLTYFFVVRPVQALMAYVRAELKYTRLKINGFLIDGEIQSITKRPDYDLQYVVVKYQFIAPDNQYKTGKQEKLYDESCHHPLPVQGTSVKVL